MGQSRVEGTEQGGMGQSRVEWGGTAGHGIWYGRTWNVVRQDMNVVWQDMERGTAGHGIWYGRTWNMVRLDSGYF